MSKNSKRKRNAHFQHSLCVPESRVTQFIITNVEIQNRQRHGWEISRRLNKHPAGAILVRLTEQPHFIIIIEMSISCISFRFLVFQQDFEILNILVIIHTLLNLIY